MNPDLGSLINFIKLTHEIRNVRRAILLETELRQENDAEHMYQLALTAWFLIEKDKLKLDKEKVIGLAMVHDIVEVYTGDIPTYAAEHSSPAKAINERLAASRLKKEWPQFKSLHLLIQEYEEKKSPEAKFVYALDKIMPMINNYLYGGRTWRKHNLSFDWLKQSKNGKADISPEISKYYQDVLKLLENNPKLFGSKK
jgi:putative hydrolase of HD superfamily